MGVNEYIYHNDDTNTYMRFQDDAWLVRAGGDDRIYVDGTNGRVGIGTNSPQTELHVNSGSSNNNTRFESTDTEVRLQLKDSTGTAYIAARNDLRFGNDTTTERMIIKSSGKVGIGTTSPAALLHLNGDGDAIRVTSTNSGAGGAQMFKESEKGNQEINIKRTKQAVKTNAKIISAACPFCNTMLSD